MVTEIAGNIIEESDSSDFIEKVIEGSKDLLIIVDFWAPWCNPCKQLTPILEEAIKERFGKVKLVKINIDDNQELAQQLRIQSVPTIMAFHDGKPINGFAGLKSKQEILAFLDEMINITSHSDDEIKEITNTILEAEKKIELTEYNAALDQLNSMLELELPRNELIRILCGMGKCYLELNKKEELEDLINNLDDDISNSSQIIELKDSINFLKNISTDGEHIDEKNIEEDPNNLELRLAIARKFIHKKKYSQAVENLLFIINKNKSWNEGKAKEELLKLFSYLGNNNAITIEGRSKLSNILFK